MEKVIIICKEHGNFEQTPNGHLDEKGCGKCSTKINADKQRKTENQFIEEAIQIHGNKYDYSKVEYKNAKDKLAGFFSLKEAQVASLYFEPFILTPVEGFTLPHAVLIKRLSHDR